MADVAATIQYDTHALFLGGDQKNGVPALEWDGVLDDIRIYSRVLSNAEISALAL